MRVLLDVSSVPEHPVGAGVYCVALAAGLATRPDVDLVLAVRRGDADRWVASAPGAEVLTEVPTRRPLRLAWEQVGAPALARRARADVWHGPHYSMPLHLNAPSVVTVHDLTFFDHPEWHERAKVAYFRRMIVASAGRANVVVCVSRFTADRLDEIAMPTGTRVVIPHGVDHARFQVLGDRGDDLARLARHGIRPPYVAFLSTIQPRKNAPGLVAAFAMLAARHPELRLVLAGGNGWGTEALRLAIERSGVATRILRPGHLPDDLVPAYLRRAAVVAYPSFEEGFGLPVLEALACGAPVVTSTGSALDEVASGAALTAHPGDPAAIAAALEAALDETTATRLRAAGPLRAAEYTWERSVDAHVDAYRIATDRRRER